MMSSPHSGQLNSTTAYILTTLLLVLLAVGTHADGTTFRSFFTRHPDQQLSAIDAGRMSNCSVEQCAGRCITESRFQCKSFDYDNRARSCQLFTVSLDDPDVHLISSAGRDNYQTAYLTLFNRLPNHRLPTLINRRLEGVSVKECARRCILEIQFKCRGFNYRTLGDQVACMLLESSPASSGTRFSRDSDYYQRNPEGPLAHFVNYGTGKMNPLGSASVYQKQIMGIPLENCAAQCLEESAFKCESFDYIHNEDESMCHLSQYIAANVYGLQGPYLAVGHYERIGESLAYFYSTPYVIAPGNNLKTYQKVTPNRCARMCMEEASFICRSFEYKIQDGTCILSDKTGSDIGGLLSDITQEVHYFEMKPLLDCGGILAAPDGNFASPNWPRNYAHHETCVWNITTTVDKVIHLHFTHFELGLQSADPCLETDDRLVVTELGSSPYCILPNTHEIITKTNQVTVAFYSNAQVDAQGFRAFYTAEWTCNAYLNKDAGQFASPKWPENYPSGTTCSWRIEAPENSRIQLRFTSFELEQHTLGHCNEKFDHVKILDGGTTRSPLIGLYCGSQSQFTVRSSGRDLFVQFTSDRDPDNSRQGFHATYIFEKHNGTVFIPEKGKGGVYVDLDEPVPEDKDKEDEEEEAAAADDADSEGDKSKLFMATSEEHSSAHHSYKRTMWAVVSFLILALIATLVTLYLVWRHYRQKLAQQQEQVIDPDNLPPEEIPLQSARELSFLKPNNLGNEVDLCSGAAGTSGQPDSPGGATGVDKNFVADFGKYSSDNVKNINLDTKACNI